MDFELSESQKLLRQNARDFLEREIVPVADEYDRKGVSRADVMRLVNSLKPFGYVTGPMPEDSGGLGLDMVSYGILCEELARAWMSLELHARRVFTVCSRIHAAGTSEQRRKFIPPLLSLEMIPCSGNSEPNAGSNAAAIQTTAVRDGDYYIVNGTKTWITLGSWADLCVLLCVTDRKKGARGGHSHLLVEKKASPFSAREFFLVGERGLPVAELSFNDCRVPRENLLGGEEGQAYRAQVTFWTHNRGIIAMEAVGVAQAAVDASVKYAQERRQFGRPIGQFQLVQDMIVDMVANVEAARLLGYQALSLGEKGARHSREASLAKMFATRTALDAAIKAVQIHGTFGLVEDSPVQRYLRDVQGLMMIDGTIQINKLIAGREILGMSAIS